MIVMNLVIGDACDHKPRPRTLANASWCLIILWFLSMMTMRAMMIMTRLEMDMLLIKSKDPCLGKMALGEMGMMMIKTRMVMELVLMKSTLVTGKSVRGEKEREHYRCVMATPR